MLRITVKVWINSLPKEMNPIPCLGVLTYYCGALLTRMVESIDYPVGKLVVVLNGIDESVVESVGRIQSLFPEAIIYNPGMNKPHPVNLGCSGGWNWILNNHGADWVFLVGNDMQFKSGDLARVAEYYERHKNDDPPIGKIDTNYGWHANGITRAGVEAMGYLDENYQVAYYEDCDYDRRHFLARKLGRLSYPQEGHVQIFSHHEGSATSRFLQAKHPDQYRRLSRAFERNVEYHVRKWGGAQCHEIFEHPFNNPALDIRDWTLQPERWEQSKLC